MRFAKLTLLAWCSLLWATNAQAAECRTVQVQLNFCKRCTTVVPASTARDTACTGSPPRSMSPSAGPDQILLGARLAKAAQHGKAAVNGTSWNYTPPKGFTGKDSFTIERDFLKDNQLFVLYLQMEMEVR